MVYLYIAYEEDEDILRYEKRHEKPLFAELGKDGWELVAIYPHNHTENEKRWYVAFLKRLIENKM